MKTILVRRHRVTDYILLAILCGIVAAILYPVFAKPNDRSRQTFVFDENGKPVAYACVQFADASGNVRYTLKTDQKGWSRDRKVASLATQVSGEYAFQRGNRNTGWIGYVFAKRGTQVFTFTDESGKRIPNLSFLLTYSDQHGYASRPAESLLRVIYEADAKGEFALTDTGLAQRMSPQINDECYAVKSVQVSVSTTRVVYNVAVDRVATIIGTTSNAKGEPVAGQKLAIANVSDHASGFYSLLRATTDSHGKFVFKGLASGNYVVRFPDGSPKALVAPQVVVRSGETKRVRVVVP